MSQRTNEQIQSQLPPEYQALWPGMDEHQIEQRGYTLSAWEDRFPFLGYDADGCAHFACQEIYCPACNGTGWFPSYDEAGTLDPNWQEECFQCSGRGTTLESTQR